MKYLTLIQRLNLREKNFWVYGFDARGEKNFTEIKWEGKNVLLFGSEGFGMREHTGKYTDFLVRIDISKKIESLNISNSAAIVFHHLSYIKKNSWLVKDFLIEIYLCPCSSAGRAIDL